MTPPYQERSWREAFGVYWHPKVLALLALGFSAGLPNALVFTTLSAWLREEGTSLTVIGYVSWIGLIYSIKFIWAPVIERTHLGWFSRRMGHRRSWMLLAQLGIGAGLYVMSCMDPAEHIRWLVLAALFVALCSATQDITVDAFRIESAGEHRQGALAASYIYGYRIAVLVSGAGALYLAEGMDWMFSYQVMALCMLVGILTVFWVREPKTDDSSVKLLAARVEHMLERLQNWGSAPTWRRAFTFSRRQRKLTAWFMVAVGGPIYEFFVRNRWHGVILLTLIGVYRLSDITMGVMAMPFYLDLGFTLTEIGSITKVFGLIMSLLGTALGGVLVARYGILRPLLLGAILTAASNLLFALLSVLQPSEWLLAMVISGDNISGGLATVVFIAYLSSLTNRSYTATQYALFSSFMTLPGVIIRGQSGVLVDAYGYFDFFVYTALLGMPAILLVVYIMSRKANLRRLSESTDD